MTSPLDGAYLHGSITQMGIIRSKPQLAIGGQLAPRLQAACTATTCDVQEVHSQGRWCIIFQSSTFAYLPVLRSRARPSMLEMQLSTGSGLSCSSLKSKPARSMQGIPGLRKYHLEHMQARRWRGKPPILHKSLCTARKMYSVVVFPTSLAGRQRAAMHSPAGVARWLLSGAGTTCGIVFRTWDCQRPGSNKQASTRPCTAGRRARCVFGAQQGTMPRLHQPFAQTSADSHNRAPG